MEEPITKCDINHNLQTTADFPDGPEDPSSPICLDNDENETAKMKNYKARDVNLDLVPGRRDRHEILRNYNTPTEFEREQFNETNFSNYSADESPPLLSYRREEQLLGASASDLVDPHVPPVGDRETPIGKGLSSENIALLKEQWDNLEQLAMKREVSCERQLQHQEFQEDQQRKLHESQARLDQHLNELQKISCSQGQDKASKLQENEEHLLKMKRSREANEMNSLNYHTSHSKLNV